MAWLKAIFTVQLYMKLVYLEKKSNCIQCQVLAIGK